MPRMRIAPNLERPRVHARVRELAAHVAPALAQDPLEREAALLGHAPARYVARVRGDLDAARTQAARELHQRQRGLGADALARARRADPVADLEFRDGPVDGLQPALADERAVERPKEEETDHIAEVPLSMPVAPFHLDTLDILRL